MHQQPNRGTTVMVRLPDKVCNGTLDQVAIITRVWSPTLVNCTVLPDFSMPYPEGALDLIDPDAQPDSRGWFWPPRV